MSASIAALLMVGAGLSFIMGSDKQAKRLALVAVLVMFVGPAVEYQLGGAATIGISALASIITIGICVVLIGGLALLVMRLLAQRRERGERPNFTTRRREERRSPQPWRQAEAEVPGDQERDDLGLLP